MNKRLIALAYYALFWLGFFFIGRVFFISVQYTDAFRNTPVELMFTFLHGVKLDISTTGYYLLIPVLFAIPAIWFSGSWFDKYLIRWYTYILILFSSIIIVADANLYSYWGFRMDFTPVLYLKTPGEAMASVSTLKAVMFFITIILIAAFTIFIYKKLIDKYFLGFEKVRYRLPVTLLFIVILGALIIPIRGGFGIAPINAGSVYFSQKMFLNHAAVNAVWNVGTSAFTRKPVNNPYEFGELSSATEIVDSLTQKRGAPVKVLNTVKPNILIVLLESFSSYLVGPLGGDSLVTPNLNRYIKEGILFSGFYASGTRTDKAMPAILSGYPAQPAQSVIKEPKKSQSLPSLTRILLENGYNSSFWYGGDINFANFNSFLIGSGFGEIVTKDNFDPDDYNSKWGVHDHVLFNALKNSMQRVNQPFFKVILTLSSHEPFDVPMEPVFKGDDELAKYRNSVFYADKALGSFLDWAKGTDWWNNTLVILVADHCSRSGSEEPLYSRELFKIPMVWIGGALIKRGITINKLGSQVDIPLTLLNQIGLIESFPFAKDLLSDKSSSFAFYTYNEGFGFLTDTSAYIYDHKMKESVLKEGKDPGYAEKAGKAYLQVLFNDYLKR